MSRLRELVDSGRVLVVPGAANALTARVIEDCGFPCVYVTGAGVANTQLAVPDVGLLAFSELAAQVSAIRTAVDVPLIVDADTGFGGPLNVHRTVRELERAGADAIQIEDQTFPKRCGHFEGKNVIATADMVAKVHAAVDARTDDDTLIVARTDARAVNGLEDACERANTYHEAGADIVFVEAPRSEAEIEIVSAKVGAPQVINFVVGGATPLLPEQRLQELGFAIALHANLPLLAGIEGMQHALRLLRDGAPLSDAPLATWEERQRLVRRAEFEQLDSRFSTEEVR